ncbi:MAG: dephospho-CoA kinase [Tannerella sp.]|jgi:dephospho-CoA kinase|nr:dephospho-CoA kinase [Tannerella sp.]
MIRIGVTGGIGSGKSVVCRLLEVFGVPVYDADSESKRLSETAPEIIDGLKKLFGEDIYCDGRLDRPRLASYIFANEKLLAKVNAIIHPVVFRDFRRWAVETDSLSPREAICTGIVAIESAILFESGLDSEVDVSIAVTAPVELRLTRAMQRDSASEAEIMKRMNRQMPDEIVRNKADFIIHNDDARPIIPQLEAILRRILDFRF